MSMALTVSQLDQQRQGSRRQHGQSAGQADDDDDEWGPPVMSIEDGGAADGPAVWDPASSAGMADAAEVRRSRFLPAVRRAVGAAESQTADFSLPWLCRARRRTRRRWPRSRRRPTRR